MSNSSMLKNLPGPLQNWEATLEILRQPTSLAIVASVGIHTLLWFVLPLLPSAEPTPLDTSRQVKVVELSPAEQSRIPQTAAPPITFPPTSVPPSIATKTPAPSPLPSALPPLPGDSSLYNIPNPPVLNIPFPTAPLNIPLPTPINIPLPSFPKQERTLPGTQQAKGPLPQTSTSPTSSPTPSASPQTPTSSTRGPAPTSSPTAPPTRQDKLSPEQLAAFRQQWEKIRQDRDKFTYNSANTSPEAFSDNATKLSEFAKEVSKDNIEEDWQKETVSGVYPKDACPFKIKGRAAIGAVLQPDGKLAKAPEILLSSGYKPLDDAALAYVTETPFEASKKERFRAVMFDFTFEPSESVCPPAAAKPPA